MGILAWSLWREVYGLYKVGRESSMGSVVALHITCVVDGCDNFVHTKETIDLSLSSSLGNETPAGVNPHDSTDCRTGTFVPVKITFTVHSSWYL